MDALFGIPMNTIMIVLLAMLAVSLGTVAYVALRNRIFFMMGLRNIPRRTAQTVLIVIGLMLSTLIISAAFATGDTLDHSISKQAYTLLGHVDETVQGDRANDLDDPKLEGENGIDITADQYAAFQEAIGARNSENIDGSLGVLFEIVPVINPESQLSEPDVTFTGLDAEALAGFPDVISTTTGEELDVAALASDEVFVDESAADQLGVGPGDTVQVFSNSQTHDFKVVDIVEDRVLTGANREDALDGMVTRLDTLHDLFRHTDLSFIAISSKGGVRDTLDLTDDVEVELRQIIRENQLTLGLGDSKKDGVDFAEEIGNFMATFFLLLGLFSIAAGILLIVMIFVMLAAERKSEMGMARAVGTKRGHLVQTFLAEGMGYNVLAAMVGVGLGILVSIGMAYILAAIFSTGDFQITIEPKITPRTVLISYSLGVVLTFLTVTFSSWRVSNLNIVAAIRGTEEDKRPEGRRRINWWWVAGWLPFIIIPPLGLWLLLRNGLGLPSAWIISAGGILFGALFFLLGLASDAAFPFALGFSLLGAGIARLLTLLKLPDRPVYTATGVILIVMWGLTAGGRLAWLFGELNGDFEMFFLSGVAMITASTYVLIYNADIILAPVSRLGGVFSPIVPALKTAIAYPLTNRFRTGMTLAMISLVVFSLTMMSTMNYNFEQLFLADDSRGGWDVIVEENTNNPISDLRSRLYAEGAGETADQITAAGRLSLPAAAEAREVLQGPDAPIVSFEDYPVLGADEEFASQGSVPLDQRAVGYESDDAVWQAIENGEDVAIVDGFTVESGGFGDEFDFSISTIGPDDKVFDAFPLEVRDPGTDTAREVQVIGVTGYGASGNFLGIFMADSVFTEVFGEPEQSWHYASVSDPDNSKEVAQEIESTLFTAGVQAESLKARAEAENALFRNFFYLMQAFMSLGLLVGIAAVGVIAFRTVVERRQHIGMLRAIGYKRSTVALSFLLESSFVTLLAIFSAIGLAIWLSYFLITSDDFQTQNAGYHVPWVQIALFAVFTYVASLLMTLIPARQAASIPTAEALRYE
jgi:putative ABC transport system permease protein